MEEELNSAFYEQTKRQLADSLGMNINELDRFMIDSFSDFLGQIREGRCVGILDYEGRAQGLFNIPAPKEKIRGWGRLVPPNFRVEHFLGIVLR